MVEINYPQSVNRGSSISVSVVLKDEDVKGARSVSIILLHQFDYQNPCVSNFSAFSQEKKFQAKDLELTKRIEANFEIPAKAPPSGAYGPLSSKWFIDIKSDVPFWIDKHTTKEIMVRR